MIYSPLPLKRPLRWRRMFVGYVVGWFLVGAGVELLRVFAAWYHS